MANRRLVQHRPSTPQPKKYGVAPTTLNRLLVWAWAVTGPTEPTQETQSVTTARKTHRELAYITKASTQPLANGFLSAAWSLTPQPAAAAAVSQTETQQPQPPPY